MERPCNWRFLLDIVKKVISRSICKYAPAGILETEKEAMDELIKDTLEKLEKVELNIPKNLNGSINNI